MKLRRGADFALLLQAALIVVPLALLSVVAIRFLRQDRAAIRLEAQTLAQPVATEVVQWAGRDALPLIERTLQTRPELQGVIAKGRVVWPPPFRELPTPTAWTTKLPVAQSALWRAAEQSDYAQQDARRAAAAWEKVREGAASKELRLDAEYRLLQLDPQAGPERCAAFAASAVGELSDSGAPLSDLALLLGLQRLGKARMPAALLSGIEASVRRTPSFLTQSLLDAAEGAASIPDDVARVRDIKIAWREREATLALARAYLRRGGESPVVQWTGEGDDSTLIVRLPEKERIRFARIPLPLLTEAVRKSLAGAPVRIPDYATLELAVEGRSLHFSKEPLPEAQRLAFAEGSGASVEFSAALYLTSEDKLFARYRQRRLLTIWLIVSAGATALIGLFGLWRTSRRQSRLSEMKSNFVSSVSHELRAPIAAIRLMAENLKDGRVEGAARHDEYFRLIVLECRRLTALVENILDFSRIDQARKKYAFEPVDLESLVGHAVAMMEPCAQERGVTLEYRGVPASVEAMQPRWDAHAVQQALVNLLDNAIKFSPKGQRVLTGVEAAAENGEAPRLGIWVEDAGEGIPAEDHGRIFELFYRRGSELRRETGGVGIGLTIVKHVAEAHGGRVVLRSAVGEGSRFSLILPIDPSQRVKR